MRRVLGATIVVIVVVLSGSIASARVLRVGKFHGLSGQFGSIQAAVNAARPGDWVLVGPGDHKEHSGLAPKGHRDAPAGVLITTPNVYIRGMNRNGVVVDGTKPGSPQCSSRASDQEFGPHRRGLNGLMAWKANNVWVQNLTACNYLHGSGDTGNEIWWNGGHDSKSGGIGGRGMVGSYLNATSTFFKGEKTAAQYGIFSSDWSGGSWSQTYASNFNDSGYYIGACKQVCNQTMDHAWAQYSALGYSGTNSGGALVIKDSEFDHNEEGVDTNSENTDFPSPQNGACPAGKRPTVAGAVGCWVFMNNYVHDNNNPNVPSAGAAALAPVGTGMSVSGGRNDTIIHNRFVDNKAWGAIFIPFPDSGTPCSGGVRNFYLLGKGSCLFDEFGDALIGNTFTNDGGYGNPTNGDFEQQNLKGNPTDCYSRNVDTSGSLTALAAQFQQSSPTCTKALVPANLNVPFLNEIVCDTQAKVPPFGCQNGETYPRRTRVVMHPLPKGLKTMPNPCQGVPANPWCPTNKKGSRV